MSATVPSILAHSAMPVIAECFGPTFQGEGPSCGTRAAFIRFGRCNLNCSWCDTKYTWDWEQYDPDKELRVVAAQDLAERVVDMDVPLLVFTGGEPMMQQGAMLDILSRLPSMRIEIETNGTIVPTQLFLERERFREFPTRFNVSPKLANSGIPEKKRWKPRALAALKQQSSIFKFVCERPRDLGEVASFQTVVGIPNSRIWVMPQAVTAVEVVERTQALADHVLDRGWNFTTRLHVLAWEGERER